ncbi:MAG: FeoB-associated Cys-rich membrane protein [Ruminococcus sp.]|nr:FeoB-associated Cys-rich membrane protein [Ruminococcus sp.]
MGSVLGTAIVLIVLAAMVTAIIVHLVKDKKAGKSSCGCNCGCCPNSSACHGNHSAAK